MAPEVAVDSSMVWIIGFVAVAVALWMVLRPRGGGYDPEVIKAALERGATILDVRTAMEFSAGHVDGARNVPVDTVGSAAGSLGKKDGTYIVYCRSGSRSSRAKRVLEAAGFTDVVDAGPMHNVKG